MVRDTWIDTRTNECMKFHPETEVREVSLCDQEVYYILISFRGALVGINLRRRGMWSFALRPKDAWCLTEISEWEKLHWNQRVHEITSETQGYVKFHFETRGASTGNYSDYLVCNFFVQLFNICSLRTLVDVFFCFFFCCSHMELRASVKRFVSLKFLNLRQLTVFLGRGISPSQGCYLTQTQNKHRDTCLEWDSSPRSQCSSGRR
jgi:hypothetical protein